MHSQFFLKSCYWNKISHSLSIFIRWTRIWHWNCKISSGFFKITIWK